MPDEEHQLDLIKETGPAVFPAPRATVAALRPEAYQGFFMRFANWDRLKRIVRRAEIGDSITWKDAAILFFGTALGTVPQLLTELAATGKITLSVSSGVAGMAIIAGGLSLLAYGSVQRRDRASIQNIIETMEDVEAEFVRQQT